MVVTITPEEKAKATKQLEIKSVRNKKTGRIYDARRFIERPTYEHLIHIRGILQETRYQKKVRLTCALCGVPVYLVAMTMKDFYFRHTIEDGKCPAVTRSKLSADEINALKYLGARESPAHKETKEFIERSLKADASFSDIKTEKRWKSTRDPLTYRQPDVQAQMGAMRVAFEVQLSTTFLSVVVGRRVFYRGENAMLIWVLRRFEPDHRRLTVDDILFSNNANILVVDDETVKLSEEQGAFIARCWYREPFLENGDIAYRWSNELVRARDLTFDVKEQRAFSFDAQGRKAELVREQAKLAAIEHAKKVEAAGKRFLALCDDWGNDRTYEELEEEYFDATEPLIDLGIDMPATHNDALSLVRRIQILRSIELGRPVGFNYTKLIQVLHTVAENYKDFLYFVGKALIVYERLPLVEEQDGKGNWKRKTNEIRKAMKSEHPDYQPSTEYAALFRALFPALASIPKWAKAQPIALQPVVGQELRP